MATETDIDTAVVVLTYEDGRIATIRNSRRAPYGYDQRVELLGSEGTLEARNESGAPLSDWLSFDAAEADSCADARPSPPASYCPATNTIVVDLPALQDLGAQADPADAATLAIGDNTAYSVLMSRYMVALQHQRGGVALDNASAALRTACLTGVATVKMSKDVTTPDGNTVALTAGDVDEAVSGILTNGLAAGDVNGETVPSGFSRIDAFRLGVLSDTDRCFQRFP